MRVPRFLHLVGQLIFPPRCALCAELLPPAYKRETALCEDCQPLFLSAMRIQCRECFLPFSDCRCALSRLRRSGVDMHVKLSPYNDKEGRSEVVQQMIHRMKRENLSDTFSYLAGELSEGVTAAVRSLERHFLSEGKTPPPVVIAHLPRNKRSVLLHGFDQAAELAKALAEVTGYERAVLLKRGRDTVEQKSLTAKERAENMKGAFRLHGDPAGKTVLLVDDVVTTGAGISEAARLLYGAGASRVLAVSVALTLPKG